MSCPGTFEEVIAAKYLLSLRPARVTSGRRVCLQSLAGKLHSDAFNVIDHKAFLVR
jgi:hypothetical protein